MKGLCFWSKIKQVYFVFSQLCANFAEAIGS